MSRSVSFVIGYLIASKKLTFNQAYKYVKLKKKLAYPNRGFAKQLKMLGVNNID